MDILMFPLFELAYIDPGSGSAIMSAIIGALVAIGLTLKTYWYKIKRFFGLKEKDDSSDANQKEQ